MVGIPKGSPLKLMGTPGALEQRRGLLHLPTFMKEGAMQAGSETHHDVPPADC